MARSKASVFTIGGLREPLTLRTNYKAAASISASVETGSKLNRVLMFLHILGSLVVISSRLSVTQQHWL